VKLFPSNVRKKLELAPLDAAPDAVAAKGAMDPALAAVVVALIGFGVVMVYSASASAATVEQHDPQFFLKRQAAYALVSLVLMFAISRFDYHHLYKLTYPAARRGGSRSARCTSSPRRWRSSRSSCGSRTRSRRRPTA
jgi:cell division protein FtsW